MERQRSKQAEFPEEGNKLEEVAGAKARCRNQRAAERNPNLEEMLQNRVDMHIIKAQRSDKEGKPEKKKKKSRGGGRGSENAIQGGGEWWCRHFEPCGRGKV